MAHLTGWIRRKVAGKTLFPRQPLWKQMQVRKLPEIFKLATTRTMKYTRQTPSRPMRKNINARRQHCRCRPRRDKPPSLCRMIWRHFASNNSREVYDRTRNGLAPRDQTFQLLRRQPKPFFYNRRHKTNNGKRNRRIPKFSSQRIEELRLPVSQTNRPQRASRPHVLEPMPDRPRAQWIISTISRGP